MNNILEKFLYSFGINLSHYDLNHEIRILKKSIPERFKGREVIDIGCGDGRTILKIKKVLDPESLRGVDVSPALVESARKRGLDASVKDVESEEIDGDLGVLWGVLHHFKEPAEVLRGVHKNFNSIIIRESIDDTRVLELGEHKFNENDLDRLLEEAGISDDKVEIIESKKTQARILLVG